MDFSKYSEFEAEDSCRISHNSHRIIKILVSFSLFSVLISFRPLFTQSLEPFSMQIDSYIIDKNYLFLLCIVILVLISKNTGLFNGSSSPSCNHGKELYRENPESSRELKFPEIQERNEEIECPEEDKCLIKLQEHEGEIDNTITIIGEDENDAKEPIFGENGAVIEYPEEGIKSLVTVEGKYDDGVSEEEGNDGSMNCENEVDAEEEEKTEELNQKCEAFIRKMRTSFRSDRSYDFNYQNALVAVH